MSSELAKAVDLIEVWNARSTVEQNERALQLAGRLQKPGMYGSDAHTYAEIGNVSALVDPAPGGKKSRTCGMLPTICGYPVPGNPSPETTGVPATDTIRMAVLVEDHRLMALSDHYLTFVKDQVELLARRLRILMCTSGTIQQLRSPGYSSPRLKAFRKDSLIDRTNLPENVSIYTVPQFYLPSPINLGGSASPTIPKLKNGLQRTRQNMISSMRTLHGQTALSGQS